MNAQDALTAADIPWGGLPTPPTSGAAVPALAAILRDVEALVSRYVVLNDDQATAIALWVAHTHAIEAADCTPYMQITSATKQAGKTRLLEVLEPIVARPWLTQRVSAAALVRKIDAEHPTLLLDESDTAFKGDKDYAEALRGLLNSGYRRSGRATICVGQGGNLSYKDFSTFGAKATAGIGDLPDTIADRSIRIELKRRTTDEPCARWREREGHVEAGPIHQALVAWATASVVDALRAARPSLPSQLRDRQADVWEPLLAIADLAGTEWPALAHRASVALAGATVDQDIVVELLTDIRDVLDGADGEAIATKDLLDQLVGAEDRRWATLRHDKPMTARGLARLLGPLRIHPSDQRVTGRHRSYRIDAFRDAFARYLPIQVGKRERPNVSWPGLAISNRDTKRAEPASNFADSTNISASDPACPLETAVTRDRDDAARV